MKFNIDKDLGAIKHKVIIGNTEMTPDGINAEENELFVRFLEGKESFVVLAQLDGSTTLVKWEDNAEKMRKHGASLRSSLPKDVVDLAVIGNGDVTVDFLEGFCLSSYQFLKYFKDKEEKEYKLTTIHLNGGVDEQKIKEIESVVSAVFWSRDMVNEPVSFLNADQLAHEIENLSKHTSLEVSVLEKAQIEALKMGGLLAVNQGSVDQPTFTIVEYKGENAVNEKPIVLVGKGVVYDTGGLSLKPTPNSMDLMKSDMGGAACMAGAIYLAALQKLPVHLIALIPATDNRPGLNAYAPGDVVTMFNGTTVEVLNTDAEGRMILADALSYSKKFDPELVIDAATLTGAAVRAIGAHGSVVMGNAEDHYFEALEKAGNDAHERTVRFPFWDEYAEEMKSPIADLKNLGGPTAGMITAGKFLEHFVDSPYIHIDLAGPAYISAADAYRTKGGTGVGVRLLYHFLKNYPNG
ncbi:MAG: leucyl aminopeptidase family protein [Crocinitomicaceae bacterium]|nr:leucyl aminopeptidase family protein [Crocinitomicaceae bacterium]